MKNSTEEVLSKGDKRLSKEAGNYNFGVEARKYALALKGKIFEEKRKNEITDEQFLEKLIIYYKNKAARVTSVKLPWFLYVLIDLECFFGGNFHTRSELMRFLIFDHFKDHWAFDFLRKNGHAQELLLAKKELASISE